MSSTPFGRSPAWPPERPSTSRPGRLRHQRTSQYGRVVNTIDAGTPTSSVTALPASESSPSFTVSWSGSDGAGPGIASYDIYVSDDGGPFHPLLTGTTQTSTTFTGQVGHTYGFFSVATDPLGFTQATPVAAQTSTAVINTPTPTPHRRTPTPPSVMKAQLLDVTVITGNGKHQKKTTKFAGFKLIFNEALNSASAQNSGNYQVLQKTKKGKKTVSKPVGFTVSYNAADDPSA